MASFDVVYKLNDIPFTELPPVPVKSTYQPPFEEKTSPIISASSSSSNGSPAISIQGEESISEMMKRIEMETPKKKSRPAKKVIAGVPFTDWSKVEVQIVPARPKPKPLRRPSPEPSELSDDIPDSASVASVSSVRSGVSTRSTATSVSKSKSKVKQTETFWDTYKVPIILGAGGILMFFGLSVTAAPANNQQRR